MSENWVNQRLRHILIDYPDGEGDTENEDQKSQQGTDWPAIKLDFRSETEPG